jgi:predicted AAA+ superfamily ATPase
LATWRPQPEELQRVLDEQNPWHQTGEVPPILAPPIERALADHLWSDILREEPRRFHLILGPRRVGKTTVMYQTVRRLLAEGIDPARIWWLRLDHPLLLQETLGDLVRTILSVSQGNPSEPTVVMLDEVVYAREWDLWLKTFYDEAWPVRIAATSSATAALRHRRLESGVGRWSEHHLTPYLFSEFLDLAETTVPIDVRSTFADSLDSLSPRPLSHATRIEALRRMFLLIGGFPELLVAQASSSEELDEKSWLLRSQQVLRSDAVERAIYKDIPQSYGVDNPMMLERLLYVLAGQTTGILSPTRLCQELDGLSQPTFDKYLSYLEKAFLVFALPNYSGRETSVQKRGRKIYFVDGAIRNAALQRGLAPLSDPVEQGVLLENLVASTLHSLATQAGVRLFHWHDAGKEVDLIFDHPEHPMAFEVASSADHHRGGLTALIGRHPKFHGRAYLIAPRIALVNPGSTPAGVGSIPLDPFLIAAGRQAEAAMASGVFG